MLKKILDEKIKEHSVRSDDYVLESVSLDLDNDAEIEMILPMLGAEEEHGEYRFLLKQLKKRNPKAYKKIVNFD